MKPGKAGELSAKSQARGSTVCLVGYGVIAVLDRAIPLILRAPFETRSCEAWPRATRVCGAAAARYTRDMKADSGRGVSRRASDVARARTLLPTEMSEAGRSTAPVS